MQWPGPESGQLAAVACIGWFRSLTSLTIWFQIFDSGGERIITGLGYRSVGVVAACLGLGQLSVGAKPWYEYVGVLVE